MTNPIVLSSCKVDKTSHMVTDPQRTSWYGEYAHGFAWIKVEQGRKDQLLDADLLIYL